MRDRSLSIVFPAYNEEASVQRAVKEATTAGHRLVDNGQVDQFEVVVVNDGSQDRTAAILDLLASENPRVVAVHHQNNRGLGAAVRSGLEAAQMDLVFYTDVDLPVDLAVIDKAISLLHTDRSVGAISLYRLNRGGEGPRRYIYSVVYNVLIRVIFDLHLRDVNFAAKLIRSQSLEGVTLRSSGSFIDAELLTRLVKRGQKVIQFPAAYRPRSKGVSTLSSASVICKIIKEMIRLSPDIWREGSRR